MVFEDLRVLQHRPHDYRSLAARWPGCGVRTRRKDWRVMHYFADDWRGMLEATPVERRVFVALSVNPEAAIEYWLSDPAMIDYASALDRLVRALGDAGFRLFIKDHPNQFGYRRVELFSALAKHQF